MSDFNLAIGRLISDESGRYIPCDNGRGPSKWGITLKTYAGYYPNVTADSIKNMTRDEAIAFYRMWWVRYNIGAIGSQDIANKTFNEGVNLGQRTVTMVLQSLVDVVCDGIIGPVTAAAVDAQDPVSLLARYKDALVSLYTHIVAVHPEWRGDLPCWIARARE